MADLYYNVTIEGVSKANYDTFLEYFDNAANYTKIKGSSIEYSQATQVLSLTACGSDPENFIKDFVANYILEVPLTPVYAAKDAETSPVQVPESFS